MIRGGQSLILHPTIMESEREGELEAEGSTGSCMLQLVPSSSGDHHRLSIEELSTPVGVRVWVWVWACGCGCGLVAVVWAGGCGCCLGRACGTAVAC